MKTSIPMSAGDDDDEGDEDDDDDDDDLIGEPDSLSSSPISDVEGDASQCSGSDEAAFEEHNDNVLSGHEDDDESSQPEASDADDILDLVEASDDLLEYDGADSDAGEWTGLVGGDVTDSKRKRRGADDGTARKKKRRSLSTFASYEDYARMIEDGPEDNL